MHVYLSNYLQLSAREAFIIECSNSKTAYMLLRVLYPVFLFCFSVVF